MNILEMMQSELGGAVMERLGGVLGMGAAQARAVGEATLPVHLNALAEQANQPGGAQKLLEVAAQVPQGTPPELLASEGGISSLRQVGSELLPQVLGNSLEGQVQRVSGQTGVSGGSVQGMMQLLLPLMLGVLGRHARSSNLSAAGVGGLFAGLPGLGAAGLGAAALGAVGLGAAGLGAAAAKLPSVSVPEVPAVPPVPTVSVARPTIPEGPVFSGPTGTMPHTNPALGRRPGLGWLWLLPLLLLLGLGGCFLLSRKPLTPLTITAPAAGATVSAPFKVEGTGASGQTVTLREGTTDVVSGKIADDGHYSLTVPTATAGDHSYALAQSGDDKAQDLKLKVGQPAAFTTPAGTATLAAKGLDLSGTGNPGEVLDIQENAASVGKATVGQDGKWTLNLPTLAAGDHTFSIAGQPDRTLKLSVAAGASAPAAGAGTFAIAAPTSGATVPAGAFSLKGSGKPGDVLEVFEDGTSLGNVTVGEGGSWSLDVPSPSAGAHSYTVKGADGAELGTVKLSVGAAAAGTAAACTKPFSLSIKDGQTVSAPYRFGGVGSGKSYDITVTRGARRIGTKTVKLDSTCGWSYTSNPGKGTITYSVSQSGKTEVDSKITLKVK